MPRIDISVFVKDVIENVPTPCESEYIRKQIDKYIYQFDKFLIKKALSVYELTYDMADDNIYVTTEIRDSINIEYHFVDNVEDLMEYLSLYCKNLDKYLAEAKLRIDGFNWSRK